MKNFHERRLLKILLNLSVHNYWHSYFEEKTSLHEAYL